jgi:nucleotide-binding universal stress UspA family protein
MKTILLYANEDGGFESRLRVALDVARSFGSHVNCIQVTPYDAFIMGDAFGGVYSLPTVLEQVRNAEDAHRARIEQRLRGEGISWDWTRCDGAPARVVAGRSRLCDLVVLSLATEHGGYDGPLSLAADVALHVRAPVLAVPPASRALDCSGPAVAAWDGSCEASQALRLALPMLGRASAVHIVTVAEDEAELPANDAKTYLSRHGIGSELRQWTRERRSTAQALIDAAEALHASWLTMGAYGHSRLREAVLGGATREMLRTSPLPLLLGH